MISFTKFLQEGEEILTRYMTPQIGSFQRIQDIQKTWHFVCSCVRCVDPSELGECCEGIDHWEYRRVLREYDECRQMPGSVSRLHAPQTSHCHRSEKELKYSTKTKIIEGSPWTCLHCGKTVGVSKVHSIVNAAVKIIGTNRNGNNELLLDTIQTLEQTLHQNHYLIIGLKEIIIQRLMTNIRKQTGTFQYPPFFFSLGTVNLVFFGGFYW